MNSLIEAVVSIATAIVGVALLAVLVSRNANTANVIGASGNAFATALGAATGPVTGDSYSGFPRLGNTNYGPSGFGF